ncbi:uncharacterized protein LOC134228971 [Saccostrea cucullata]|uniref:uncharacterized protein LOC134228971 n=1 Tax=Saccostrea cuccullata TaxID=36930 RepID=UPI002ED53C11
MVRWVKTTGSNIPEWAIEGGYEANGRPLFIARAQIEGVMIPGKCGNHLPGAHIPYRSEERIVKEYDVLITSKTPGYFDWQSGSFGNVPSHAFRIDDGIYVGRAFYQGGLVPGKVDSSRRSAYISYGGEEIRIQNYDVFCEIKLGYERGSRSILRSFILPSKSNGFLDWQRCSNGYVPPNAIKTDEGIYVGRAYHKGSLVPGKILVSHSTSYVCYEWDEHRIKNYEVLTEVK